MKSQDLLVFGAIGVGVYLLAKGNIFKTLGGVTDSVGDITEGAGSIIQGSGSLIKDVGQSSGDVIAEIGTQTSGILDSYKDHVSKYWAFPFTKESRDNVQNKFFGFGQSSGGTTSEVPTTIKSVANSIFNNVGMTGSAIQNITPSRTIATPVTVSKPNAFLDKLGYTGTSTLGGIVYTPPTTPTFKSIFGL